MTTEQLAARWQVSKTHVIKLRVTGKLAYLSVGNGREREHVRFPMEEVLRYEKQHQIPAVA